MRNISQLVAALALLASQVNVPAQGNIADAASAPATAATTYEVSLQTNTPEAVVISSSTKLPSYDNDVLNPLRAAQAKSAADAAAKAAAAKKARINAVVATPVALPAGSHSDWMAAAGIAASDYGYVDYIVDHESGWGVTKSNYGGSGAYGLGQALPATKMAKFGSDYMTNPVTQLRWATAYATGTYGSWAQAYAHWTSHHNW